MGRSEEDAEAVGRRDACGTFLLVDKSLGAGQDSAGHGCGPPGGERLVWVGGSSNYILVKREFAEDYGGGVGDSSWPTTRWFVIVVGGHRRVWEIRMVGDIRSIVERVGGVYHSKMSDRTRAWTRKRGNLAKISTRFIS